MAEIYYPDTLLPAPTGGRWPAHRNPVTGENPPPVHDFQNYQQYLHKRAGAHTSAVTESVTATLTTTQAPNKNNSHCDGVDDIGCFQVRCYLTKFLVLATHMFTVKSMFKLNFSYKPDFNFD